MRKDKTSSLKSLNASCKLFHCSYWISVCRSPFFLPAAAAMNQAAASPHFVQLTGTSDTPTQTQMSLERGDWGWGPWLYPLSSFAACSSALSEAAEPSNLWEAMAA